MALIDFWNKEIAPSPSLRKWFDHRIQRFAEFKRRYRDELKSNQAVADILTQMGRGNTTLLFAARDPAVNHAAVLAAFLTKAQREASGHEAPKREPRTQRRRQG